MFTRMLKEDAGVITIEWIILITVLVAAAMAFLGNVRDALASEAGELTDMITSLDQSPRVPPAPVFGICEPDYNFFASEGVPHWEASPFNYCDCNRGYRCEVRSGYRVCGPTNYFTASSCPCGSYSLHQALVRKYSTGCVDCQ